MPRTGADSRARPARGLTLVRGVGFVLAVALGGVAVWLIVTSTDQKRIEIGVLAGLWGLLIGAYAAFGTRRGQHGSDHDVQAGTAALELRRSVELERAADVAARREHEQRLEYLLRHEMHETVGRELSSLRTEIAALRNELVDKVGGQLRLEHTETTRIIGSDIEALQREVRQLKASRARAALDLRAVDGGPVDDHRGVVLDAQAPPEPAAVESMQTEPVPTEPAQMEPARTEPVPPKPAAAEPASAEPASAEPVPDEVAPPQQTQPQRTQPQQTQPQQAPAEAAPAEAAPAFAPEQGDTFAGLPRLTPFTDFDLDPSEPADGGAEGREQAPDEQRGGAHTDVGGRHTRSAGEHSGGGRRHRDPDSDDDVLARILAREAARG